MRSGLRIPRSGRYAAVGLIAALLGYVAYERFQERTSPNAYHYARAAQETAVSFPTKSLATNESFDQALSALISAERAYQHEGDSSDSPNVAWHGAVRTAMEYLQVCGTADPDAYAAWARKQGKKILSFFPDQRADRQMQDRYRYEVVVGKPMLEDISPRQYFDDYFTAYWSRGGQMMRPQAIAVDPRAIEVRMQTFRHWGDFIGADERQSGLGPLFWRGGIVVGGLMFWWPQRVIDPLTELQSGESTVDRHAPQNYQRLLFDGFIQRYGSLQAARVLLVYRSVKGINVPVSFFLVRRPTDGVWEITGLVLGNIGSDVGVGSVDLFPPLY